MNDGVATSRGLRERALQAVGAAAAPLIVKAVREEAIDDVRADETGPAADQDLHPTASPTTGA